MPPAGRLRPGPALQAMAALLAILAAGCVAGDPASAPAPSPSAAEDVGRWVNGTVLDEELRPVADAVATSQGAAATATSDLQGRFRLVRLPARNGLEIEVRHAAFQPLILRVDLLYVPHAELRFVLRPLPAAEAYHVTNTTVGKITCQLVAGSHEGVPGRHEVSCAELSLPSHERVVVPFLPGIEAGMVELTWRPQSQLADIMGLAVHVSTSREEILLGEVHSEPGDHYVALFTGTWSLEAARAEGGAFDSSVHLEPSLLDEHVPTNVGFAYEQEFTLHTTAFYGAPPPPTWSALAAK